MTYTMVSTLLKRITVACLKNNLRNPLPPSGLQFPKSWWGDKG